MPTMSCVLGRSPEEAPQWLQAEEPNFCRREFFGGRTVYYPGSGFDGQPVELCAKAHAAHSFIYVDSGVERSEIADQIADQIADTRKGFRGYVVAHQEIVEESRLRPDGWRQHVDLAQVDHHRCQFATPYAWLVVLCRAPDYDDDHGPRRLAVLFVGGDGVATFDALYCQADGTLPPYLVVTQDHGSGGNYDRFGANGLLEAIADATARRPRYLLVGDNTCPWNGFTDTGATPEPGGARRQPRRLFETR